MLILRHAWLVGAVGVLCCSTMMMADEIVELEPVGKLNGMASSPDGKRLLTAGGKAEAEGEGEEGAAALMEPIYLAEWDVSVPTIKNKPQGHEGEVCSVAYSPDGRKAASGGADGTIIIWYANTWRRAGLLKGAAGKVPCLSFNPAGNRLASGHANGSVCIWDLNSKRKLFTIPAPENGKDFAVRALAYQPKRNILAIGGNDPAIRIWDATDRKQTAELTGPAGAITDLSFSLNGELLLAADSGGPVRVWNVDDREILREFDAGAGEATRAAYSLDCRQVLTSGPEGTLKLWEAATGKLLKDRVDIGGATTAIRYSPDQENVFVGLEDRVILVPASLDLSAEEEEDDPSQRNRMFVWGPPGADQMRGGWGVMVYKSVRQSNPWVVKWRGREGADVAIRAIITGNVELAGKFKKDREDEEEKKKRRQEVEETRGRIVAKARLDDHEGGFAFTSKGSRFNLTFDLAAGKERELRVENARIYIGRDGVHPRSNPFTLYREKNLPPDDVLEKLKRLEGVDERKKRTR